MPPHEERDRPDRTEPGEEPEGYEIEALDVCPSCGAPLGGSDATLCVRCGYDLRSLTAHETSADAPPHRAGTGAADAADGDDAEDEAAPPMTPAGAGATRVAVGLIVVGVVVLLAGHLAGIRTLFPGAEDGVAWPERLETIARFAVQTIVLAACGLAALAVAAWIDARPLGDLRGAAARLLATIVVAECVRFVGLPWPPVELVVEILLGAVIFVALVRALFRLSLREALGVLAFTAGAVFIVAVAAAVLSWAL